MQFLNTYIKKIAPNYAYAISYSIFRGTKFNNFRAAGNQRIMDLKRKRSLAKSSEKAKLNAEIHQIYEQITPSFVQIINKDGQINPFAQPIHRFQKWEKETIFLHQTLHLEFEDLPLSKCIPIYRDALVFYTSDDEVLGVLHICFQCDWMVNQEGDGVKADEKVFENLRKLFLQLGHPINEYLW